jgi:hypothetical protein
MAIQASTLFRIEKRAILQGLHATPAHSEKFIALLLARNIDMEEDLCEHDSSLNPRRRGPTPRQDKEASACVQKDGAFG